MCAVFICSSANDLRLCAFLLLSVIYNNPLEINIFKSILNNSQTLQWWLNMPLIPVLWDKSQEDLQFEASLDYIVIYRTARNTESFDKKVIVI